MRMYVAHAPVGHPSGDTSWRSSQLFRLVADASRTSLSDGALLAAMRRGDEAAAGTLYDRHASTVMALTFRMVRERADAESIVLETFMQAWRDAGKFDASRGSALSWLITIARTRALDFLRTTGRQAKLMPVRVDDMPAESFVSEDRSAAASYAAEQREQQQAVAPRSAHFQTTSAWLSSSRSMKGCHIPRLRNASANRIGHRENAHPARHDQAAGRAACACRGGRVVTYTREQLLELASAYALGATTVEETAAVEAAMRTSPELAAEVASFRDVAATMAQGASMAPSPSVRDAFLKRIGESKQAPMRPTIRTMPAWMPIAFAASTVLVIGLGTTSLVLQRRVESLEEDVRVRREALARAAAEAEMRQLQLNAILEGDKDLHLVHLKTADTVSGPGIQFFWNARQGRGLVHAFRLKSAPAGRAYQVWLLVKGQPVGVKVFNSDADGHALVTDIVLPTSVAGVTDVLVTEEPAGGSPLPTTTPFIGGKMRAE